MLRQCGLCAGNEPAKGAGEGLPERGAEVHRGRAPRVGPHRRSRSGGGHRQRRQQNERRREQRLPTAAHCGSAEPVEIQQLPVAWLRISAACLWGGLARTVVRCSCFCAAFSRSKPVRTVGLASVVRAWWLGIVGRTWRCTKWWFCHKKLA